MSQKHKRHLITHIKIEDACCLLKITQTDLLQLTYLFDIKTEVTKSNVIFNPLKKRQPFKKFNNKLLNTKLLKSFEPEFIETTIIKRDEFNKDIALEFAGNECYSLKDINRIYNSNEYKTLIQNIKIRSEKNLFQTKGRDLIKHYKEIDYLNIIMKKYRTLDEALSVLPKYLTILFLFQGIFKDKSKYEIFIKNGKEILFSDIQPDEYILNNMLNYFLNKIGDTNLLKFIYCAENGYYIQLNIEGKQLIFLLPGQIEIKEPTAILFYNFKYALNLLKIILYKLYGEETNTLLKKDILFKESPYTFNSKHSTMLHLIGRTYNFNIIGVVGEIVSLINKDNKYIHPQYLFDSFNNSNMEISQQKSIDVNDYKLGNTLPKQIYPFKKAIKEYSNLDDGIINNLSIKKQFLIEELKKEEEMLSFFN